MITKNKKIKKDGKTQDLFFSVFITVIFVSGIVFLAVSNYRIKEKRAEMISRIEELKKQIAVLEEKNSSLRIGLSQATSTAYQEEKIREQGYQKPGEQNIVVVPPEEKAQVAQPENQKSWWEKLLEKINF